jgi:hypothetical protein
MQGKFCVLVGASMLASGAALADIKAGGGGFVDVNQGPFVLDTGGGAAYQGNGLQNDFNLLGGALLGAGPFLLDSGGMLTDDGRDVREPGTGSMGHEASVLRFTGGAGGLDVLGVWGGAFGLLNGTPVGGGGGGAILTDNIIGGALPGLPGLPGLPALPNLAGFLPL